MPPLTPMQKAIAEEDARKPKPSVKRGTLAAIVGVGVATALGVSIPSDESGRKVSATIAPSGELQVIHLSGKQYLKAYLDIVGVATACDGLTRDEFGKPIRLKAFYTEGQCASMLEFALVEHAKGVMNCSPGLALSTNANSERMREGPRFASVSLAYNVGVGAYCGSTARKLFNAGAYTSGCEALTRFNKAGGKINKGLVARRKREYTVCLGGLPMLTKVYR